MASEREITDILDEFISLEEKIKSQADTIAQNRKKLKALKDDITRKLIDLKKKTGKTMIRYKGREFGQVETTSRKKKTDVEQEEAIKAALAKHGIKESGAIYDLIAAVRPTEIKKPIIDFGSTPKLK